MDNSSLAVIDLLTKAASQNPELIKIAEQQLKCFENERGYYPVLMAVVLDRSIDAHVRFLAAVCLKNGIDRFWRKTAPNAITQDERDVLRQKFLLCFDEPVTLIARQIALIISKVARLDWPNDWSGLFPSVTNAIQQPTDLHQRRGLLVLYHIVKMLASKRLGSDQQTFQQITLELFPSVLQLWTNYCTFLFQEAKNPLYNPGFLLEKCLFSLKIMRKLVIYGFKDPGKHQDVTSFMMLIFQQFKPFFDYRKCMVHDKVLTDTCEKYLVLLAKVLLEYLNQHALAFVPFIQPALECAVTFCFTQEYKGAMFERFTVRLLNLVKEILVGNDFYNASKADGGKAESYEVKNILENFFTVPMLQEMLRQLVLGYFVLTQEDIDLWEEEPEEFVAEELNESWKFNLRPSMEKLFFFLFREYKDDLTPVLMEMINSVPNLHSMDFDTILKKEAIFNAAGLVSFELYHDIDFEKWLSEVLVLELKKQEKSYYIVRRRVIWLIGKWLHVQTIGDYAIVYGAIVNALDGDENLLVRLSAAKALTEIVDQMDFDLNLFSVYLERIFSQLFALLKEVKECDLKMSVIHVLSAVIHRTEQQVELHADLLIDYLHQLWSTCGEHWMLRCAIISCFSEIVCNLGDKSEKMQPILTPMIAFGTDLNLPGYVYVLDDMVELWWCVIQNTVNYNPALLDIASHIMPLIGRSSDTFHTCLKIMEGYILLCPTQFLDCYGEQIVQCFNYVMTNLTIKACAAIMEVVEIVLVLYPSQGSILFRQLISSCFTQILESDECPFVLDSHFSVLSRIILDNQALFGTLLQEKAVECKLEIDTMFSRLLTSLCEKISRLTNYKTKKLLALAFASLLTLGSNVVEYQICGLLLAIIETFNDITRVQGDGSMEDVYVKEIDCFCPDEWDETSVPHVKRITSLQQKDPVYNVELRAYLKSQLASLEQSVGKSKFDELISTVDVETMQQLRDILR